MLYYKADQDQAEQEKLYDVLSIDERKRVSEYKFARDAQYYTCARGILRTILGHYLTMEPQNLNFMYNNFLLLIYPKYQYYYSTLI